MPPQVDLKKLALKDQALLELLGTHHSVYVYIDTRREGVMVPDQLRGQQHVAFLFGYALPVPVRDMSLDADALRATLSFGRVPYRCVFPWSAVFLIVSDSGIGNHWPKDTPADFVVQREAPAPAPAPVDTKKRTLPPWMRVIEGGKK